VTFSQLDQDKCSVYVLVRVGGAMTANNGRLAKNAEGGTPEPARAPAFAIAQRPLDGASVGAIAEMMGYRTERGPWLRDFM
jgi:hypothetical protein